MYQHIFFIESENNTNTSTSSEISSEIKKQFNEMIGAIKEYSEDTCVEFKSIENQQFDLTQKIILHIGCEKEIKENTISLLNEYMEIFGDDLGVIIHLEEKDTKILDNANELLLFSTKSPSLRKEILEYKNVPCFVFPKKTPKNEEVYKNEVFRYIVKMIQYRFLGHFQKTFLEKGS